MSLLQLHRGDTETFTVNLTDSAGEPLDLGALDLTFTAKRLYGDTVPFLTKTIGAGIDLDQYELGRATITIDPADTEDLTHTERFVWDVQVDNGTDVRTPLKGRLVVVMDVTHVGGS